MTGNGIENKVLKLWHQSNIESLADSSKGIKTTTMLSFEICDETHCPDVVR